MSYVYDVTLVIPYTTAENVEILKTNEDYLLRELDSRQAGGTKIYGSTVLAAGVNYLQIDPFRRWLELMAHELWLTIHCVVTNEDGGWYIFTYAPSGMASFAQGEAEY